MWWGWVIAGIGAAIKTYAIMREQKAMANTLRNEMNRQGKLTGEAQQHFGTWLDTQSVETAKKQLAEGVSKRMTAYASQPGFVGQSRTPADESAITAADSRQAEYGSYNDWGQQQHLASYGIAQKLRQIEDFARGSARVFPSSMYHARHSQEKLESFGSDLYGFGSTIGGMGSNAAGVSEDNNSQSSAGYWSGAGGGGGGTNTGTYPAGNVNDQSDVYNGYISEGNPTGGYSSVY